MPELPATEKIQRILGQKQRSLRKEKGALFWPGYDDYHALKVVGRTGEGIFPPGLSGESDP